MTIKQQGGIFGRNPTFNDVDVDGNLSAAETTVTANSTVPLTVNRTGSQGDTIQIEDDGTKIGTVGVKGGALFLADVSGSGLRFESNAIVMTDGDGDKVAASYGFGLGSYPIGNIYQGSGYGIYMNGGTGASNKFSDYEEGTYEPSITGSTSGSATLDTSFNTASYVKIGTIVHVNGQLRTTATTVSGTYQISLPFTAVSGSDDYGTSIGSMVAQGITYDADTLMAAPSVSEGEAHFTLFQTRKTSGWLNLSGADVAAGMRLRFQLTYRTA